MSSAHTEQADFWRGAFGDEYARRNAPSLQRVRNQTRFWAHLLNSIAVRDTEPESILEVGANVGINLRALKHLTDARLFAVEPNDTARNVLIADEVVPQDRAYGVTAESIPLADGAVDLAFTAGVLIHVNPEALPDICSEIYRVSRRLIACVEYFSAYPEAIAYRGYENKLFKRDFGAFWLEQFPSLQIIDYGFAWKPVTGLDNVTWWIFKKASD